MTRSKQKEVNKATAATPGGEFFLKNNENDETDFIFNRAVKIKSKIEIDLQYSFFSANFFYYIRSYCEFVLKIQNDNAVRLHNTCGNPF